jgi:SAM-dependent methyltransferase
MLFWIVSLRRARQGAPASRDDRWRVGSNYMDKSIWDRRYAEDEFVWTVRPSRFLAQEAAGLPAGRALDLACGEGRNAVWLAERGWRVTGVDFSEVGLEKARRLAAGRGVEGDWIAADLLEYRSEPRAFDLVVVLYLQVPRHERTPILRAAAEAVAEGGTLLVVAHDSRNIREGYGGPQRPEVLYTADDVVRDIEGSGLLIERAERVERTADTAEGVRIALDALVRASRGA